VLTTKTSTFSGCIDHIWCSDNLEIESVLAMPYAPGHHEVTCVLRKRHGEPTHTHIRDRALKVLALRRLCLTSGWGEVYECRVWCVTDGGGVVQDFRPIPDARWGSDHLAIGVTVLI
jgi:hypothetical protein